MGDTPFRVLFLCTGNSARSILAEALLPHLGGSEYRSYSAGSQPTGIVNPLALETLESHGVLIDDPRSKSWDEFADTEPMDLVVTVCNQAAGEVCPVWPGRPRTAHWGIPDPAAVEGSCSVRRAAFESAYKDLERLIVTFLRSR
ncbi:MAG: arsenate reductase ArsC [Gammaproteobacteria bacterium]